MSKESYIGGDNIVWVGGTTTEFIGKGTYSSQQKLLITSDGTKHFGNRPEVYESKRGEYIIDGYRSRDLEGTEKISGAKIGDKVYFQVNTQNIPTNHLPDNIKNKVTFHLFNFKKSEYPILIKFYSYLKNIQLPSSESEEIEYIVWDDINENNQLDEEEKNSIKPYDSALVTQAKAVIPLTLTNGLNNFFAGKRDLKLYFKLSYYTDLNIQLPKIEEDFLKIKCPKGKIIFQRASVQHSFPMLFDAKTGDPYYIDVGKKVLRSALYGNCNLPLLSNTQK